MKNPALYITKEPEKTKCEAVSIKYADLTKEEKRDFFCTIAEGILDTLLIMCSGAFFILMSAIAFVAWSGI